MSGHTNLIGMIVKAFEDWPPPTEIVSDPDGPFAEGTVKYFSGKLWQQVILPNLSSVADAMVYFTPEAHRYYLPAYMVLSLASPEDDDFSDFIIFHFSKHEDPFWAERIDCFSPEELETIEYYIRAIAEIDKLDFVEDGVNNALEGLAKAKANKSLNPEASKAGSG